MPEILDGKVASATVKNSLKLEVEEFLRFFGENMSLIHHSLFLFIEF